MFSHLLGTGWRLVIVDSLGGASFHVLGNIVFIADAGCCEVNLETARRAIRTARSMHTHATTEEVERTRGASRILVG